MANSTLRGRLVALERKAVLRRSRYRPSAGPPRVLTLEDRASSLQMSNETMGRAAPYAHLFPPLAPGASHADVISYVTLCLEAATREAREVDRADA